MHVRPEGVLSFRSCGHRHRLTVFVMSLIILITIRMCRPVLIKKIAQSFADSLSTDPSPSDMCIDFVAENETTKYYTREPSQSHWLHRRLSYEPTGDKIN